MTSQNILHIVYGITVAILASIVYLHNVNDEQQPGLIIAGGIMAACHIFYGLMMYTNLFIWRIVAFWHTLSMVFVYAWRAYQSYHSTKPDMFVVYLLLAELLYSVLQVFLLREIPRAPGLRVPPKKNVKAN